MKLYLTSISDFDYIKARRITKYLQCYDVKHFVNRPYLKKIFYYDWNYRYLTDEIHQWFMDLNIEYTLSYEGLSPFVSKVNIEIEDNYATLFKLVWL
jgi:hypothetical protein